MQPKNEKYENMCICVYIYIYAHPPPTIYILVF